ncbi:CobW family GTP-binding protein [Denitrobaculum tricleocarpae]|uniref:GTP-binding protein n=1 Tax=Denitrobaculum tricleocarpae TaxID=2591009 RepID=A0A545TET3_9PROT|nr:GTP-binding protein [Denitrobaculum tricleocarpae]TQV75733.1 GTP-binding protein [Denitrobaculum tricleocarpae]
MDSKDQRLPLTVITGYLGAGKTTLVNHMLRHADGRRIMVLVNDFGDIAVDADLIESQEGDTLTLANGCICCSMGGDLFYALSDALDRQPRPDHLLIEASGVADPTRISEIARAEPELRLDGTIALLDALGFPALVDDAQIGSSLVRQIAAADLIVVSKSDLQAPDALSELKAQVAALAPTARQIEASFGRVPLEVLLGSLSPAEVDEIPQGCAHYGHSGHDHANHDHAEDHEDLYSRWSLARDCIFGQQELADVLKDLPAGLLRLKGFVKLDGCWALVQAVGGRVEIESLPRVPDHIKHTTLVAIGLKGQMDTVELNRLFSR